MYRSENHDSTKENQKEHVGDAIYELKNKYIFQGSKWIAVPNHFLQNLVNPSKTVTKTLDIENKIEKTIFYPKLSIKQHNY